MIRRMNCDERDADNAYCEESQVGRNRNGSDPGGGRSSLESREERPTPSEQLLTGFR